MWMVPALVTVGLLVAVLVCGVRAVWQDLRTRRWIWALAGTIATVTGAGALLLVVSHASMTAQIGL
jgi:hypothetical protein